MSTQLHGTWRCIKWIRRGREENRNDPILTFNPDGSATSSDVDIPMRWRMLEGKLCIEFVGLVETVGGIHRVEMPDPNTLVLDTSIRCSIYKKEVDKDAPASSDDANHA